jgi:Uma2 family endonuclease
MSQVIPTLSKITRPGEPVWEIAELFPEQGGWSEQEYLALSTNRLVEFDNGIIEVLPLPTRNHQLIAGFIYDLIKAFVARYALGGKVFFAPYRLRVFTGKHREADVFYLSPEQFAKSNQQFTEHADLVVEVVSPDDPDRDYVAKRAEYARAGVSEYWIVDESQRHVLVLRLENGAYVEHGRFTAGQRAASHRFPALTVSVDDVFNSCL